jgi:hypothetical protein
MAVGTRKLRLGSVTIITLIGLFGSLEEYLTSSCAHSATGYSLKWATDSWGIDNYETSTEESLTFRKQKVTTELIEFL